MQWSPAAPPATPPSDAAPSEADVRALIDAAQDAIVAIDPAGSICFVNRQASVLFGYEPAALIGQPLELLVPTELGPSHVVHRATFAADPRPRPMGIGRETSARRQDGSIFPVDVRLSSIETDRGPLVSASVRDVSERRRSEARLGDEHATLLATNAARDRDGLEAQLQQAQRMETVGQLAGGVAHDFNNLLAAIMNYAGLVSTALRDEMASRGLDGDEGFITLTSDVDQITTVAKRAATLTRQLLIFSRRKIVHPEPLDLNAVVAEMEELLRRTIGENVDRVRTILAPNLPLVIADRGQIDQVLMNLAVNARDAMPGGGELKIATSTLEGGSVEGRRLAIPAGPYVLLTVSDTGIGMSAEVAARAFEPHFTTKSADGGSGLGLATVHGIVSQAGGGIAIQSAVGSGTSVEVALPASLSGARAATQGPHDKTGEAGGETVLLVEDEAIVREPAARMLTRFGYRVFEASSAAAAIAIAELQDEPIDLLLTDIVMPGRSGQDLALEMAQLSPTTKVLFMSGYSPDVVDHQGVLEGRAHLIEKPFTTDDILRKIRIVLESSR